jgi:hypothetical protein
MTDTTYLLFNALILPACITILYFAIQRLFNSRDEERDQGQAFIRAETGTQG